MAPRQAKRNILAKDEKIRSQGFKKGKQPSKKGQLQLSSRKSARLEAQRNQEGTARDQSAILKHQLRSRTNDTPKKQGKKQKRKPSQEDETASLHAVTPSPKWLRTPPPRPPIENALGEKAKETTPLEYWRQEFRWPKEYFEPESSMDYLFARQKSPSPLRGTSSAPSSITPSDEKPRETKSAPYSSAAYEFVLANKGSFMDSSDLGISEASNNLCRTLLDAEQSIPQDTLFRTDLFDETCKSVRVTNEAMVIRDISPLICPSAKVLRIYGAKHLKPLSESANEGWNCAIPFYGPRPQPDYSVGFGRHAFTNTQVEKLIPFVGEPTISFNSYFMATWQIYFPFLTCEVKSSAAALRIADRQNAHSMTLAVRSIVELFRVVRREKELHREILAFSISHNHEAVQIYGHYPLIDGSKTTFYRHTIKTFDFTNEEGRDKWTSYKFAKNVYDIWMPTHLKRICSAIDDLPLDLDFKGF